MTEELHPENRAPAPHTVVVEKVKPSRPASWAIFLVAIASLLGTIGLVQSARARSADVEEARAAAAAASAELADARRQIADQTAEARCRSAASANVLAALGHLVSTFSQAFEGAYAGDPSSRREALSVARALLDNALTAQQEAQHTCKG